MCRASCWSPLRSSPWRLASGSAVIRRVLSEPGRQPRPLVGFRGHSGCTCAALPLPRLEALPSGGIVLLTAGGVDPLDELRERTGPESRRGVPDPGVAGAVPHSTLEGVRHQRPLSHRSRVPPVGHLPARQSVLGFSGHRSRAFLGACTGFDRICLGGGRSATTPSALAGGYLAFASTGLSTSPVYRPPSWRPAPACPRR